MTIPQWVLLGFAAWTLLVLFTTMARMERRAHWSREEGLKRSERFQRRVFLVGVGLVIAMVATLVMLQLVRTPRCLGTVVMARGSDGRVRECVCEAGRRGECFEPGP